jgi:hypothetical protein
MCFKSNIQRVPGLAAYIRKLTVPFESSNSRNSQLIVRETRIKVDEFAVW